jgi:hypothetical protein
MRFQDLLAYKKGLDVAMEIFEITKKPFVLKTFILEKIKYYLFIYLIFI